MPGSPDYLYATAKKGGANDMEEISRGLGTVVHNKAVDGQEDPCHGSTVDFSNADPPM